MPPLNKEQTDFIDLFLGGSPERLEVFVKSRAEADALIEVAEKAKAATTQSMTTMADKVGGEMVGLKSSVKSQKSLTRKIFDRAELDSEDPAEVGKTVNDVLRFTTVFATDKYVDGVKAAVAELFDAGHTTKKRPKNTWGEVKGYRGINAIFVSPENATYELQFHTPESFDAKEHGTHDYYEEQRRLEEGSDRRRELEELQNRVFAQVPRPKGAENITF